MINDSHTRPTQVTSDPMADFDNGAALPPMADEYSGVRLSRQAAAGVGR
ncbi:hypothetical protein [Arthrobacter psychrolactophilus]